MSVEADKNECRECHMTMSVAAHDNESSECSGTYDSCHMIVIIFTMSSMSINVSINLQVHSHTDMHCMLPSFSYLVSHTQFDSTDDVGMALTLDMMPLDMMP